MFIKGKCAIYIDKNLRVYEKSTVIFVLWLWCAMQSFMAISQTAFELRVMFSTIIDPQSSALHKIIDHVYTISQKNL